MINSGNSSIEHQKKPFGSIKFVFEKTDVQEQALILGENIREWAPGNLPGALVNSTTDEASTCVWQGKNTNNNDAVIDMLKLEIRDEHKQDWLQEIVCSRNIELHNSAYLVFSITILC